MKQIIIYFLKIYQKTLSPDHGWFKVKYPYGFCKFYPSCSQYSIEVIQNHGAIKGIMLSLVRISKCNPFTRPQINKSL